MPEEPIGDDIERTWHDHGDHAREYHSERQSRHGHGGNARQWQIPPADEARAGVAERETNERAARDREHQNGQRCQGTPEPRDARRAATRERDREQHGQQPNQQCARLVRMSEHAEHTIGFRARRTDTHAQVRHAGHVQQCRQAGNADGSGQRLDERIEVLVGARRVEHREAEQRRVDELGLHLHTRCQSVVERVFEDDPAGEEAEYRVDDPDGKRGVQHRQTQAQLTGEREAEEHRERNEVQKGVLGTQPRTECELSAEDVAADEDPDHEYEQPAHGHAFLDIVVWSGGSRLSHSSSVNASGTRRVSNSAANTAM